jgi:hypothetical protein
MLGCDDYEKNTGLRNEVVPFLRYCGVNNIDSLLLYSVKNEKNIRCLRMNFRVYNTIKDEDLRGGAFYQGVGREAKLNMTAYMAELEYKNNVLIFTKLLAGKAADGRGKVIYTCFYSDNALAAASKNNFCIINSGTIKGFNKRKPVENGRVWDVADKGCFQLQL